MQPSMKSTQVSTGSSKKVINGKKTKELRRVAQELTWRLLALRIDEKELQNQGTNFISFKNVDIQRLETKKRELPKRGILLIPERCKNAILLSIGVPNEEVSSISTIALCGYEKLNTGNPHDGIHAIIVKKEAGWEEIASLALDRNTRRLSIKYILYNNKIVELSKGEHPHLGPQHGLVRLRQEEDSFFDMEPRQKKAEVQQELFPFVPFFGCNWKWYKQVQNHNP